MIEFSQVTKRYGKKTAVTDISFVCENHAVTVLLGPNGAGKTTVLKAAAGIHYPTEGSVFIDGVSVESDAVSCAGKTAFVTELPVLPSHFTVLSYLNTLEKLYWPDLSRTEQSERVKQAVVQCALDDMLAVKIKTLSKGYQQRVSFAAALLKDADNLILDEPVSGLDPSQIVEMRNLIRRLSGSRTILLSTHLMQEAEQLSDRIIIMHQGHLTASGTKEELLLQTGCKTLEDAYIACTGGLS